MIDKIIIFLLAVAVLLVLLLLGQAICLTGGWVDIHARTILAELLSLAIVIIICGGVVFVDGP